VNEVLGAEPLAEPSRPLALLRLLDREALLIVALTIFLAWIASVAGYFVRQDTWLALVSGREVAQHWLPHHDTLTIWTHGVRWIDQQWLAQLWLYWLALLGGHTLLLVVTVLSLFVTLLAATAAARSLGASPARAAIGAFMAIIAAPWETELRAQSFALPLFVLVYWLLVTDARRPSRRVLLVLPILVLWANLHGSVTLAAGLVVLHGVLRLVQTARRRVEADWLVPVALIVLSPLAPFASPYGFALGHYYRLLLFRPPLADFVIEWRPAWDVDWLPIPFYILFFATVVILIVTRRRPLYLFEYLTLGLLGVGGFLAIRWIDWFGLAAAVSLPRLLTLSRPAKVAKYSRARALVAGVAVVSWPVLILTVPRESLVKKLYPDGGAQAVLAAVRSHPGVRVFPDDSHADWLLWEQPALAGRIAYDVRFELTTRQQLQRIVDYKARHGASWKSVLDGYRIVVFDTRSESKRLRIILREPGARVIFRKGDFAVVLRAHG
jgi:hypothetical protein